MEHLFKPIDSKCGSEQNITALSVFSGASHGILMLLTIPLNGLLIYSIIIERKKKCKLFFYKLLLNIAVADLLTGLIVDPSAMICMIREALRMKIPPIETTMIHLSLFFTDAVALITLTLLSIDRIIGLLLPIRHYKGMNANCEYLIVFVVWPIACLLVLPYFWYGFIRHLLIFSAINISDCVISLVVTTIVYKRKITNGKKNKINTDDDNSVGDLKNTKIYSFVDQKTFDQNKRIVSTIGKESLTNLPRETPVTNQVRKKSSKITIKGQNNATRTFLVVLCVFVATYLPTCFTMIYMNVCTDCDCVVVHVMRDISIISIQLSSVLRPLNFILSLKHLKSRTLKLIKFTC